MFDKCGEDVLALFTANAVDENPFVAPKVAKAPKAPKVAKQPKTVKVTVPAAQVQGVVKVESVAEDVAQSSKDKAKARAEFMKMLAEVCDEVKAM